jgi:hexosaminidase
VNNIPLNPASDFTYEFLQNFLAEIVPMFEDKFFHIGGDEVVYGCWEEDTNISAFMKSKGWNSTALYQYYHDKQLDIFKKIAPKGNVIGWEELYSLGVLEPNDPTTVHVWKDKETLYNAAKDGHSAILSQGWYLDKQVPGSRHYEWEDTWIDFYTNEPFDGAPGPYSPKMMELVLGGEGCMWSEQVDERFVTLSMILQPSLAILPFSQLIG